MYHIEYRVFALPPPIFGIPLFITPNISRKKASMYVSNIEIVRVGQFYWFVVVALNSIPIFDSDIDTRHPISDIHH